MPLLFSAIIIALLILINGLFVAAEFSIIGVRHSRIEQLVHDGDNSARWVLHVLDDPGKIDRYIATAQLGITLASLGLGMYAEPAIAHVIEEPLYNWFGLTGSIVHTISFIVALGLVTYFHVVIGEMVPKSLALHSAERMVLLLSTPMRLMGKIFSLAITFLNHVGFLALKLLRIPPSEEGNRLYSLVELDMVVSESFESGLLEAYEQELVASILDFADTRVEALMVPRIRMQAIPVTFREQDLLALMDSTPFSRLPVYGRGIDDIIGVLHLKDFVRQQLAGDPFSLRSLLREVSFVPETMPIKALLSEFRRQHRQIAIVIDEHGGTTGLITLEDLLEQVVGDVRDEFDVEDEDLHLAAPGHLVVEGSIHLDEVRPYVDLGQHDVHSVGGLIWSLLGRRPEVGSKVTVGEVTLRVEAMDGLTITRAAILFPSNSLASQTMGTPENSSR